MDKPLVKIEKWFIDNDRLFGFVKDHPKAARYDREQKLNGEGELFVTTSKIVKMDLPKTIETANTIYVLGEEQLPFLA